MKKGDKLYCKKDTHTWINQKIYKGNECFICAIDMETTYVGISKAACDITWLFYTKKINGVEYIWDHFYTKKEIRKLKIQKLNENRR